MDGAQLWWEICQKAGIGASVVTGPILWVLWKERREDREYLRETEKGNIELLSKLTRLLENAEKDNEHSTEKVIGRIDDHDSRLHDTRAELKELLESVQRNQRKIMQYHQDSQ